MPSNSLAKWLFLIPSGRHITSREISGLAPTWKQNWSKDFLEKMQSSIEDQIPFSSQEMSHQNKCSSVTRWFYRRLLLLWALALVQGDRLKYHHWSLGVLGFGAQSHHYQGRKKREKLCRKEWFWLAQTVMDLNFSMAWCKRVLPCAHEVYLKGLPPCCPTSTHETHLERGHCMHFGEWWGGPAVLLVCWEDASKLWSCMACSLAVLPCRKLDRQTLLYVPGTRSC